MDAVAMPEAATAGTGPRETGRLLWRCRRGMKELDVILERYAREGLRGGPGAGWGGIRAAAAAARSPAGGVFSRGRASRRPRAALAGGAHPGFMSRFSGMLNFYKGSQS